MRSGCNSRITGDTPTKGDIHGETYSSINTSRCYCRTFKIHQKVAIECGKRCIVVHYSLDIAKPAMQIRITELKKYDNFFIAFGPFHICMA